MEIGWTHFAISKIFLIIFEVYHLEIEYNLFEYNLVTFSIFAKLVPYLVQTDKKGDSLADWEQVKHSLA